MGVTGTINGESIALGNEKMMTEEQVIIPYTLKSEVVSHQKQGKTVSYLAVDGKVVGYVAIGDKIKKTSVKAIKELQKSGIAVIMLTGDNHDTAKAVAEL